MGSAAATPIKRRYRMRRVRAGDYILPANDLKTWWRIATYEDGPSYGVEGMSRDRTFWGAWKWIGPGAPHLPDLDDWNLWDMWEGSATSRNDAIQAALRAAIGGTARERAGA